MVVPSMSIEEFDHEWAVSIEFWREHLGEESWAAWAEEVRPVHIRFQIEAAFEAHSRQRAAIYMDLLDRESPEMARLEAMRLVRRWIHEK